MMRTVILPLLLLGFALPALADAAEGAKGNDRVYELRTYHLNPGKLDAFLQRFRTLNVPLFPKHGLTIVGCWTPQDEKDGKGATFVYLLSFPSRDAAKTAWASLKDDATWKERFADSEKDGKMVSKVESVYLEPTDYSPTIHTNQGGAADSPRVFELRTYHTSPGKLDDLNKRFKDHTIGIFNQHKMTSIAYFVPQDEDQGRKDTLVYFLAFPNRDAAKASWQAFRDDPNWQKVKAASEADGVPLAAKVTSVYLEPTDVSPLK